MGRYYRVCTLQPGHAGRVISFFNGALIRTLGMGTCLTSVANNGYLLAKLAPQLLYVATLCMSINYRLKFASKTNRARYRAKQTGSQPL